MREHMGLFRGKRIDNGEWVIGYLCRSYYKIEDACICCTAILNFYSVIPDTIGECTGLKDKNGKLIWEGDIIKNEYEDNKYQYFKIFYNSKTLQWEVMNIYGMRGILYHVTGNMQIIGNIHDNPELLKGGEG